MNPTLPRLGLAPDARVAIIHADDIGMCEATLPAWEDLAELGLVTSAATMVPCPWFPRAAALCRAHPEADMGVHLTLTCEWDAYRWGPVSTRDPATGLLDEEDYLHRTSQAVWERAEEGAVRAEIGAQLERALSAGVDVTHIDTHMLTLGHPCLSEGYVSLALSRRLPLMAARLDPAAGGWGAELVAHSHRLAQRLEAEGVPVFDAVVGLPLDEPADRVGQAKRALDGLPAGLSLLIIHPARDTPELRAIAPDWRSRVADYEAFTSPELRDHIRDTGIELLGYRALRDLLRRGE